MNKKGFTLIELITTFALSSAIIVLLINLIIVIKNVYFMSAFKTNLYVNQANLSREINKKLDNNSIISYVGCLDSDFCYDFNLSDGTVQRLSIIDNIISFGDYKYKLENKCFISDKSVSIKSIPSLELNKNNSLLKIKIQINCADYNNIDFGINVVYAYNSNITEL